MKSLVRLLLPSLLWIGILVAPLTTAFAADISITAANVVPATGYRFEDGTAGATITAGQLLYKDSGDSNKFKLVDNDASATASVYGIALNGAASGQPIRVQTDGTITIGGTVAVGTIYVSSSNAGGIAPSTDLASGDYTSVVGIALTTGTISMSIFNGGVARP